MGDQGQDGSVLRWVLAAAAALATLAVLAIVIGAIVPRQGSGKLVDGVDVEEMQRACRMVSGDDAALCQRVQRVAAAIDDGNCVAAEVQARPVLAAPAEPGSLREQLHKVTRAQLARCAPTTPSDANGDSR